MSAHILTDTFVRIRSRLLATARRMLADDSAADDALQDAFYKLWSRRDSIETRSQAEGLSVIAVRNTCLDALRRQSAHPTEQLTAAESLPESDDSRRDLYLSVKEIIDSRLSDRERLVITMRDTQGMDFADIAEELGITEANTRVLLSRARKTVREIYLSTQKNQKI